MDAALFYDAGKVAARRGDLDLSGIEHDYGVTFALTRRRSASRAGRVQRGDPHTALPLLLRASVGCRRANAHVAQEEDQCDSTTGRTRITAGSICT